MSTTRTINLVGGRGYTGSELLRLIAAHPDMELGVASSRSLAGEEISATCEGWPEDGIEAGTKWEDVSDDWCCPYCGATKADFHMVEVVAS